jgi:ferric-dicitrate binding protein FerR (iron transport regulator)
VILNAQSSIRYPQYFTDSTRNLELLGEAFFEVAHDAKRPFSVFTGNVKTKALGTSFNVNARQPTIKISLATGKVKVDAEDMAETIILEPGFALSINLEQDLLEKQPFDIRKELSWKDGVLYFKNTAFKDIVPTLELWYDVAFEIPASMKISAPYTGQFDNASLEHVLENMGFALNFDFTIKEKKVILIHKP